jgi:hypothetical protein
MTSNPRKIKMSKTFNTSLATLVLTTVAASTPAPATAGRFCTSQMKSGEATGMTEDEAKKAATVWWSSRAGAFGKNYEFWADAKDKTVNCHPGPHNTFKCIAAGKPCLPDGILPDNAPKRDL